MSQPVDVLEAALHELDGGGAVALAAVVATRGSTPQSAGALLCVDRAARLAGTLGGGCVEADVRRRAHGLLDAATGAVVTFELDHDDDTGDGLICGGRMDVAIQVLRPGEDAGMLHAALATLRAGRDAQLPIRAALHGRRVEFTVRIEAPPRLVIVGGGHIGRRVAELSLRLGFHVSVIDDRVQFANSARFPPPLNPVVGDIAATLRGWAIDACTCVVIVTRGHVHDESALEAVLASPARYIGMIGSRRKIQVIFDNLRRRGARDEQLARVAAPIGLDIHAVTTEEIALSIAAQLTQVRRAEYAARVDGPIPIAEATA